MRTMLLLGTTGIILSLGSVGAQAIPLGNQSAAPNATFDEQLPTANSGAPAIAGRSAFTIDGGGEAPAMGPDKADRTLPINRETGMRKFILLAIAAVVAGFWAVGAIASRILDGQEFFPGGVADQPPYGLLRANLANLDGLMIEHSARGTRE